MRVYVKTTVWSGISECQRIYSTVSLVPPTSTMDVYRGIT